MEVVLLPCITMILKKKTQTNKKQEVHSSENKLPKLHIKNQITEAQKHDLKNT